MKSLTKIFLSDSLRMYFVLHNRVGFFERMSCGIEIAKFIGGINVEYISSTNFLLYIPLSILYLFFNRSISGFDVRTKNYCFDFRKDDKLRIYQYNDLHSGYEYADDSRFEKSQIIIKRLEHLLFCDKKDLVYELGEDVDYFREIIEMRMSDG